MSRLMSSSSVCLLTTPDFVIGSFGLNGQAAKLIFDQYTTKLDEKAIMHATNEKNVKVTVQASPM